MTTARETLSIDGCDPDDLAAHACAALIADGREATVRLLVEGDHAVAIEVFEGECKRASFPTHPMALGSGTTDIYPAVIEACGRLGAQRLKDRIASEVSTDLTCTCKGEPGGKGDDPECPVHGCTCPSVAAHLVSPCDWGRQSSKSAERGRSE
jgi:hypothetical protein